MNSATRRLKPSLLVTSLGLLLYQPPAGAQQTQATPDSPDETAKLDTITVTGYRYSREHLGDDTDDRFYSNDYSGRRGYLGLTYKF